MARRPRGNGRPAATPDWYKDAVLYELHVRAFADSAGDGIGDFRGLAARLDYLQDLGVTAIWLLPFYPSPLRDDGYDTADYTDVHPAYGTLADFRLFLAEAHRRGLRVVTELVLNHTSDQHPWFQRARRAAPGSPERDFYVWSETPERYREARIIFKDFEPSNWSWDPVAGAYYWHRFYSHQPDLNWDNPAVLEAMLGVLDFWLGDVGVDGLRLDAVPYLFEREGTNCENLPETHQALKRLRRHVDQKYGDRMLLAEANQWPEDAVAYFGQGAGDECHTAFHFPLMPRMFMAIRTEDRYPIVDMLEQTPAIPESAQWILFLRNHDELTLEMVTDEERDYMYRVYARDPRARINLGIRRRLAPLLGNSRPKIELMNGLLFSMPGTPVIYYGDEIGMGDNFYLGDRNGVRTPMQWSPDRNAGFSHGNPQRLYLPVIVDPEYHYETVNVEVQDSNPESLLWWTKRILGLRRRFKAFGRGSFQFLHPDNPRVLAFLRQLGDENILVVANLSRHAQHAEIDLAAFRDHVPLELFGLSEFPPIGDRPYPLSLGAHGFYWFSLQPPRLPQARSPYPAATAGGSAPPRALPQLGFAFDELDAPRSLDALAAILPPYLLERPWYAGRLRNVEAAEVVEVLPVAQGARLLLVRLSYTEGEPETYALPVQVAVGRAAEELLARSPQAALAHLKPEGGGLVLLYDAAWDPTFAESLLAALRRPRAIEGRAGALQTWGAPELRRLRVDDPAVAPRLAHTGRSHSVVVYGQSLVLKLARQLHEGVNPGFEMGMLLTERAFPHTPPILGAIEYRRDADRSVKLGILQRYVPNEGSAWHQAQDELGRYFERALAEGREAPLLPVADPMALAAAELPPLARETVGAYLGSATRMGQRLGELHLVLSRGELPPDFAPEPFSTLYQRSLIQSMRNLARQTLQRLRRRLRDVPPEHGALAQQVLQSEPRILESTRAAFSQRLGGVRIRTHGDFHLGNLLYTGKDYVIVNFEGDPTRSMGERRIKRSPLRDVASMVRSFQYAAHEALFSRIQAGVLPAEKAVPLSAWAAFWETWCAAALVRSYLRVAAEGGLALGEAEERSSLLRAYAIEKALQELAHEMQNRPEWMGIPLRGLRQLVGPAD